MLKNHIKIAWRNLTKNKLQTTINLLGLTIGMVSSLCILVYVFAQFGYDTHHDDANSIYRIATKIKTTGNSSINSTAATASPPIAFAVKEDYPEVLEACRVVYFGDNEELIRVKGNENGYYESRGYVVDSTFFKLFDYQFIEGTSGRALYNPNTVVLSSSLAKKLFGNQSALNKSILMGAGENEMTITVTGVFEENKAKSHLNPNYLLTMNSPNVGAFVRRINNYATQNFAHSYIKLSKHSDAKSLEGKLPDFLQRRGAKDLIATGFDKTLFLQPVTDIHLHSKGIDFQIDKISDIQQLYSMLILALIIVVVACINFINLSTARANKRAKEIGVRKTIGANKGALTSQFLGESIMLAVFAAIISIPITILVLPYINDLTQASLVASDVLNVKILIMLFGLSILTGLLAGIYPALILSSIKPITVLRGSSNLQLGHGNLRKGLVVFQFVVSTVLIVSVIIITQQLKYAQTKDLGFDKEQLLAVKLGTNELTGKAKAITEQLQSVSGVKQVSGANNYPSEHILGDFGMHLPNEDPNNIKSVYYNGVGDDYLATVGTKLLKGRTLMPTDSMSVIVNKATIDMFNIPLEKAIGSKIVNKSGSGTSETYDIIGVVENYHFASLKETVKPLLLYHDETPNWLIVKAETTAYKTLLNNLKNSWKQVSPHTPFQFTFIDDHVRQLYEDDERTAKISTVFTVLAILISCLGLFGLISFVAEQKKKEIGIRKVLGASISSVVNLITKDFIKLVIIALIIATPIAYFLMQNWLQDFVYRITIQWWVFVLAGGAALLITFLTVGFQSVKAAMVNPTKSLRTE